MAGLVPVGRSEQHVGVDGDHRHVVDDARATGSPGAGHLCSDALGQLALSQLGASGVDLERLVVP